VVPDVVRGISDYRETAAALQAKGQFYNVRTSWDQRLVQELARNVIEMQLDLLIKKAPDDYLMAAAGVEYLEEENKQYVPQAFELRHLG